MHILNSSFEQIFLVVFETLNITVPYRQLLLWWFEIAYISLSVICLNNFKCFNSSPARKGTEPQRDNPNADISKNPEQNDGNDEESPLTPWEKWLIEKSKLERKKVREEVCQKLADLKAKEEEEEKQKERRRYIEGQVRDWLRAKEKDEKQERAKQDRKKRREQKEKILVKQKRVEKDKVQRWNRCVWFQDIGVYD